LRQFAGLIDSWSATAKLAKAEGTEKFLNFCAELGEAWGDPRMTRRVEWDITLLVTTLQV
jgi:hypothetical protein